MLICSKCLSRSADGKALKRALKSELKQRSQAQGVKRPRVVMTGCLGLCPKRAVVAASAASLQRGEYLLLKETAEAAEAAALLMPEAGT
ncbi:MAG TPA: (2Fe-2S) ferredoxin domain-containing protein [Rhodopseudomonas sp.]|uniref:(2Fe-2S) ferredoxin domain-containing protein n=1 Tax=Rhodopseudomonas sp. TaxID=1078 RepID=UPI002EDA2218